MWEEGEEEWAITVNVIKIQKQLKKNVLHKNVFQLHILRLI